MRKWRSHKIVEAEPIKSLWPDRMQDTTKYTVEFEDGSQIEVKPDVFKRAHPKIGDYLVRYEDGYVSWSPKKTFEKGYDEIA
jgi:hypothetical protein